MSAELDMIREAAAIALPGLKIDTIFIPNDYENTVQRLDADTSHQSGSGLVSHKIDTETKSVSLIINSELFSEGNDIQVRIYACLHELFLARDRLGMLIPPTDSAANKVYYETMYKLYDVYTEDREALRVINIPFPERSDSLNKYISSRLDAYAEEACKEIYVKNLTYLISYFRFHRNSAKLLRHALPNVMHVAEPLVHYHAYVNHIPELKEKKPMFAASRFMDINATVLMRYFRLKYETENFDLTDGLPMITNFLWNFGLKPTDTDKGLYCEVQDV